MTETRTIYMPVVTGGAAPELRQYHGCASAVAATGEQCFVAMLVKATSGQAAAGQIAGEALWLWPEADGWRWHAGDAREVEHAKTD